MVLLRALVLLATSHEAAQPQRSFWELVVNDAARGEVTAALDGDEIWLPVVSLEKAGLHRFDGERRQIFDALHVRMSSLEPEVTVQRDDAELVLRVFAAPRFFDESVFTLLRDRPEGISYSQTASFAANYSVNWDETAGTSGYGQFGLSMFGVMTLDAAWTVDPGWVFGRGLTALSIDKPSSRLRLQVGDIVVRSTALGSAPIFGGIQFGRDYRLDPYYYRYPSPFIRGTVTTRSNVDIYVNGSRVRQLQIGPGPYQLDRLPVTTGLSDVRVVVRDPLGREQTVESVLYQAVGVLRKGEQDFQYTAGKIRDDSTAQPTYLQYAGTAQHRIGVTNWFTFGANAEGDELVVAAGPTISMRLWRLGELQLDGSWSRTKDGLEGRAAYGVYTFIGRHLNLSLTGQLFEPSYSNLFVLPDGYSTDQFAQGSVGIPVFSFGGLTYTYEYRHSPAGNYGFLTPDGAFDPERTDVRQHTLRYNMRLPFGSQLTVQARRTDLREEFAWTGFAGLTVVLGRGWATASTNHVVRRESEGFVYDFNKSLPLGPGIGFRVNGTDMENGSGSAVIEANTRFTRLRASYDVFDGGTRKNGAFLLSGGLVANRGGFFVTRPNDSSGAVVEVPGVEDVQILVDNVAVGRTGGSGRLFVTDLLPYLANRISFREEDLPFDFKVPVSSQLIAPPYHGAAYVKFLTSRIQGRAGTARIIVDGKEVVPAYGAVTVQVGTETVESPLNGNGEFFLDLPDGRHQVTLVFKGQSCVFEIDAVKGTDLIQNVGTKSCAP